MRALILFLKNIIKGVVNIKEETEQLTGEYHVSNEMTQKIKKFEGYLARAYQDVVGVWTIGYGNTYYADGTKVKEGDTITRAEAEELFAEILDQFSSKVSSTITSKVNQCQFDALVSFTYNVGIANLKKSTLLKKVNADPNDPTIRDEFLKWNKAAGKPLKGLTKRRQSEANLYFS